MYKHSHLGVYAVIENSGDQILLIKKARGPYTGLFDLPGGSMEEGELLEETLIREIQEETGMEVVEIRQLGAKSIRYDYRTVDGAAQLRHIGILYHATVEGTLKTDGDGQDSNGAQWFDKSALTSSNATPFVLVAIQA